MSARLSCACVTVLFLLLTLAASPLVMGQDLTTKQAARRIDLEPTAAFLSNATVNLASVASANPSSAIQLERDALSPDFMEPGRYLGPYVRTSRFAFTYDVGGNFSFEVTYRFNRSEIMSGASTFWIRWPVDVADYSSFCVTIYGILLSPYRRCEGDVQLYPLPPVGPPLPDFQGTLGDSDGAPAEEPHVIRDATGLYVKEWLWLLADRDYRFNFTGTLSGHSVPSVWLTFERYQTRNETTFFFANPLKGSSHREVLSVYPAFAFNFLAGIADAGLTSYRLPFVGSSTYMWSVQDAHPASYNDHVSIYIPFAGAVGVNWEIHVTLGGSCGAGHWNNTWWLNDTRQFLLTSSPSNVSCLAPIPLSSGVYHPMIFLHADQPVVLLGVAGVQANQSVAPLWTVDFGDPTTWAGVLQSQDVSFPDYPTVQYGTATQQTSPFIAVDYTTGRWAQVTPGEYYVTYDFGWGRAYLFPGEVQLYMFLNNGTALGYDSVLALQQGTGAGKECKGPISVSENDPVKPVAGWINGLACFILSLIGDVIGTISTAFQAIWDGLRSLGQWLYNTLIGFADWIVKVVTAMWEVATQIAFSLLTSLPFILVLFVAARGLPDVLETKEETTTRLRVAWRRRGRLWGRRHDKGGGGG